VSRPARSTAIRAGAGPHRVRAGRIALGNLAGALLASHPRLLPSVRHRGAPVVVNDAAIMLAAILARDSFTQLAAPYPVRAPPRRRAALRSVTLRPCPMLSA
jgi:hypothetical protein